MGGIIEVRNFVKRYGGVTAVDGISFSVAEGSLFAFLGPNGAGKSTTINVLCTALGKTGGELAVNGFEVGRQDDQVRGSIGVVFQHSVLDNLLTVRENIEVRAGFYSIRGANLKKRIANLTETLGLGDFVNRRYGELSGGQRRRADVARALVNSPKVLFLDEPTTGLDPQTRLHVWASVNEMRRREGMTVFLTTHYMEEAAAADDVAIIDYGKIAAHGTPAALKDQYSSDRLIVMPRQMDGIEAEIAAVNHTSERRNDTVVVPVHDSLDALAVLKRIEPLISSFEVLKGDMDDVFMAVTGHRIRGEGDAQ